MPSKLKRLTLGSLYRDCSFCLLISLGLSVDTGGMTLGLYPCAGELVRDYVVSVSSASNMSSCCLGKGVLCAAYFLIGLSMLNFLPCRSRGVARCMVEFLEWAGVVSFV